jgi:hypothetical protein
MSGAIQATADAVLDLLRAAPNLTVYPEAEPGDNVQVVPAGAGPPYVAVHLGFDYATGPSGLHFPSTRVIARAYCHCVGHNDISARAVAQMVTTALLDVVPTVPGRSCYPIRFESGAPPRTDESTGRTVTDLAMIFRLETLPG